MGCIKAEWVGGWVEKVSPFVLDHGYIFFFRCDLVDGDNLFAQISFLLIIKFLLSRRHNRGDKINNIYIYIARLLLEQTRLPLEIKVSAGNNGLYF